MPSPTPLETAELDGALLGDALAAGGCAEAGLIVKPPFDEPAPPVVLGVVPVPALEPDGRGPVAELVGLGVVPEAVCLTQKLPGLVPPVVVRQMRPDAQRMAGLACVLQAWPSVALTPCCLQVPWPETWL
jgi:hypothetical protein